MPRQKKNGGSVVGQDHDGTVDLGLMTLDTFRMWSDPALKSYLAVRGKSVDGTTSELAARAFIAWEEGACINPDKEHAERMNLAEYKERLVVNSSVLPDPFTLDSGWLSEKECKNWPSIYFWDISNYLKLKTPALLYHRLCNEYKQGKAYRYFTSGWVKEVSYHPISKSSPVCFLSTRVCPSMSLSSRPYRVWACVKKDDGQQCGGEICCAYCTCTAGLQGSCNHVAGLLFRIEYAVRTGLTDPACTSLSSVWDVPANLKPSAPTKVSDMTWKKDQYFNQDRENRASSVAYLASKFTPMSESKERYTRQTECVQKDLADAFRSLAPNSCFIQLYDAKPFPAIQKPVCPLPLISLASSLAEDDSPVETLLQLMKLTPEEISIISEATKQQSESEDWKVQRQGRITASNACRVYTRAQTLNKNPDADPSSVVSAIIGYGKALYTAPIKHGLSMEQHAKIQYLRIMKNSHKKFWTIAEVTLSTSILVSSLQA